MNVKTRFHGVREYSEEDIIYFKKGLPGFEAYKKFIIFPVEEQEALSILHSVEDENVGLVVISPFAVIKEYEIKLSDNVVKELKISEPQDVLLLNTVTLSSVPKNITVNMKAPIVININANLGEQIILDNDMYEIKHPLIKE